MTQNKLYKFKKNAKHRIPKIIVGVSVVTAIASTFYFKQSSWLLLYVPLEPLEYMKESGDMLRYETNAGEFLLKAIPNT